MKLSGAQAIIKVLLEQEVDTVFGYPGGQVIPLYNALYDAPLRNVLTPRFSFSGPQRNTERQNCFTEQALHSAYIWLPPISVFAGNSV